MRMVDVGQKKVTKREAIAQGLVLLKSSVVTAIRSKQIHKGNVLEAARIAGIMAVKKTPGIIPLCHPLPIESVEIDFSLTAKSVKIKAKVTAEAKTGVEMEALTAVSIAALTIYDMCKPLGKGIVISEIKLLKKTGGKSGTYIAPGVGRGKD